jgi:hypothetical protein
MEAALALTKEECIVGEFNHRLQGKMLADVDTDGHKAEESIVGEFNHRLQGKVLADVDHKTPTVADVKVHSKSV